MTALSRASSHLLPSNLDLGPVSRKNHWCLSELGTQIPAGDYQMAYQLRNRDLDNLVDARRKRYRSLFAILIESCFAQVFEAEPS
jgi:hypothetical protein